MANKGWISIHRKIRDCAIWDSNEPYDRRSAWIDLLLSANHSSCQKIVGNMLVDLEAGEFITSQRKLQERWGWSATKVKAYLDLLQSAEMIRYKSDTQKTTITIVNYGVYQLLDDEKKDTKKTQKRHEKGTKETRSDHEKDAKETQKRTNNNDNNINNSNNENNEDNIIPPLSPQGEKWTAVSMIEDCGFSPAVEETIKTWVLYKKEKHQMYKQTGLNQFLTLVRHKVMDYGDAAVIKVIEESMGQNYQGVVWDWLKPGEQKSVVDKWRDA